jgi:2,4-diketo-3-deoxy-L-fuconate hydrolase
MRLVSYGGVRTAGDAGAALGEAAHAVGILVDGGRRILPLSTIPGSWPDSVRGILAADLLPGLARAAAACGLEGCIPRSQVRLGPPIPDPPGIICIGLNYRGHATEQGKPWPTAPLLFSKAVTALAGPEDGVALPDGAPQVDYEVELVVVIGRRVRRIAPEDALGAVAGYMVANDLSARRWQREDGQWFRSKSCDGFFPCGPALVTADEVPRPQELRLTTEIAGERLQDALVADLIHDIPHLIAAISQTMTLLPGTLISTGTPAGVGCYRTPPRFLAAGDVVTCAIGGPVDLGGVRTTILPPGR